MISGNPQFVSRTCDFGERGSSVAGLPTAGPNRYRVTHDCRRPADRHAGRSTESASWRFTTRKTGRRCPCRPAL